MHALTLRDVLAEGQPLARATAGGSVKLESFFTELEQGHEVSAPSRRTWQPDVWLKAVWAVLPALVLAGCASAPKPSPLSQAIATSAKQGNLMAQLGLGTQLLAHARSPQEQAEAVAWIRRAAEGNLAIAQAHLGNLYLTGNGVPQDTSQALQWLHRAAERGAPAAQMQLGALYAIGNLVPVDKGQAYYWYSVAAKPVRSDVTIFNIEQVRRFARRRAAVIAGSLTPAQRAAVDRRVAAWVPLASVPYSTSIPINERMP